MALEETDLSPRELAERLTDEKRYFVSREEKLGWGGRIQIPATTY